MAGLYQTLTTWNSNDVLYAVDVDNEFQNVRNNMIATSVEGYSSINNVFSQTRAVAEIDPAPGGVYANCVDNQTVAGEIEKLRFVVHRIIDGGLNTTTYGTVPARSLLSTSTIPLVWYLPFYGEGQNSPWVDTIKRGGIINSQTPASPGDFPSTQIDNTAANAKFGLVSLKCGGILGLDASSGSQDEGTISSWFRNLSAGDYILSNYTLGISLYCSTGTGFLTAAIRLPTAASNSTKNISTVATTGSQIGVSTYKSAIMRWAINSAYGANTDSLQLSLNGSSTGIGTQLTAQTFAVNYLNTGNWFVGSKENTPAWTDYEAMNVTPDNSTQGGQSWTKTGSLVPTVSNGVLTGAGPSVNLGIYTKSSASAITGISLSGMCVDFKVKLGAIADLIVVQVRDQTLSRGMSCLINFNSVTLGSDSSGAGGLGLNQSASPFAKSANHNFQNWTCVRLVSSGSPNPTTSVYIDGVFACSLATTASDGSTSNNSISFIMAPGSASCQMEWIAYAASASTPYTGNASSGNLDDIACFKQLISDPNIVSSIAASSVKISDEFGSDVYLGIKPSKTIKIQYLSGGPTGSNINPQTLYFTCDGARPVPIQGQSVSFVGSTQSVVGQTTTSILLNATGQNIGGPSGVSYIPSGFPSGTPLSSSIFDSFIPQAGISFVTLNTAISGTNFSFSSQVLSDMRK